MTRFRRTYRDVDGQRVDGTWRHIFIRNLNTYFLTDLVIYADGAIDSGAGNLTDLHGLAEQLRRGQVTTSLEDGASASAHHLASWRFAEPEASIDADMLLGEVADEIDRLNDRPDSTGRCLIALDTYLADPIEEHRLALRERYLAIPEHLRPYALGDMDRKDLPLRLLITDLGETVHWWPDDPVVTDETRVQAAEYCRERQRSAARWQARVPADGPEQPHAPTLTLARTHYPKGFPPEPGIKVLQNDYPTTITVNGADYPTVVHAYWALSTTDPNVRDQIANAVRAYDAQKLAEQAPRRPGWPAARLAVMAALLRAKYTQHPQLAQTLLDTGDARIIYTDRDSAYWVADGGRGANWIGRLLEVIRSELAMAGSIDAVPLTSVGMDLAFAERFAEEWAAAWNSHDLERILAHYSDDVTFSSPKIVQLLGDPSGEVRGKEKLREYWAEGLRLLPNLHFTVEDVRASIDSVVINYRNERGRAVSEVLTFRDGLVCRGFGAYGPEI